jgi:hypothetical protein
MRYDFECAICKVQREIDVKLEDAPKVGERYFVSTDTLACSCGARVFNRIMDKKTGGFTLNFRRVGL